VSEPETEQPSGLAAAPSDAKGETVKKLVRGCGCTFGMAALGLGILIIGNFDSGAWASALGAVVISFLVYNLSGVNGFWER
jgi:hypothetical protein